MASSYTSNSGIEKPAEGDQTGEWGDTVNTNMDIIDRSINGVGAITLSGTTHTLTTTDGTLSDGMYKVLVLGGSPSGTNTITISPNDQDKVYIVVNGSGQTATFTQGSGGNVSVLNGDSKIIYADGAGSGAAIVDVTADLSFSSVNIDGGTIDGTPIGAASASTGAFTNATASGTLGVTGETTLASHLNMGDNDIIKLGDSVDLQIYHDGSNSRITDGGTGNIIIATSEVQFQNAAGNEVIMGGAANGAVTLYYDNAAKLATVSGGVTVTGEVAATSLDISGDADIDGTLEADAMTLNGTAITTTATLSTGISNTNVPVFTSGVADDDFLRVAGTSIEGRSAAEVLSDIGGQASLTFGISNTNAVKIDSASVADDEYARFTASGLESRSTAEVLSDIGGQASLTFGISNTNAVKIDSASVADDEYARFTANGLESRSTAEVLSDIGGQASLTFGISNTNAVKIDSASVADDEYARFTANGLESRSTSEVLSDIGASAVAGSSSIVTTGALNSGSITSGFGTINNGSSTITTTGVITGGSLLVADAGTIGSASDTDAVAISSAGQVSFSATNAIKVPVGTTAQRPSNAAGLIRYNSTLSQFEGYTSAWGGLGGGATGGGADQVFVENSDDVTTNYTITSGKNAMSVGPITVESGVVVTIPSGSRWVVL